MFGNRARNKNIPKVSSNVPIIESNIGRMSSTGDVDDTNSLPSSVTEIMSIIRLSWDFMTTVEVY